VVFRRRYFTSRAALQRALDGFMHYDNTQRPHQGSRVRGRTPGRACLGRGGSTVISFTTLEPRKCPHRFEPGHTGPPPDRLSPVRTPSTVYGRDRSTVKRRAIAPKRWGATTQSVTFLQEPARRLHLKSARGASMTRGIAIVILFGALALGGCASAIADHPAASPAFTPQAECERNGGWWRPSMNFCEYRSGSPGALISPGH
jgi:hypothetical protein